MSTFTNLTSSSSSFTESKSPARFLLKQDGSYILQQNGASGILLQGAGSSFAWGNLVGQVKGFVKNEGVQIIFNRIKVIGNLLRFYRNQLWQ